MKYLQLIAFVLFILNGSAKPLQFANCDSEACNKESLENFEETVFNALQKNMGYIVSDSLYMQFSVTNSGDIQFRNEFVSTSMLNLIFAKKQLSSIGHQLHPTPSDSFYTWIWKVDLPKKMKRYGSFNNVESYPKVPECNTFNERGQRACFKYALRTAQGDVNKTTTDENAEFTLFFQGNKIIGVQASQLPMNKTFTDRAILTINQRLAEMTSTAKGNTNTNFQIDISFNLYGDSAIVRDKYLARLDYLASFPSKQDFLLETYYFKQKYYAKKHREGAHFFMERLASINFDQHQHIRVYGRKLSIDSIRAIDETGVGPTNIGKKEPEQYSFSEVEHVPVYRGCSKQTSNNDKLKACFQQSILKHVGANFKYPEQARKNGIQGRVYINFVVEKDGSFDNIDVVRGAHPLLDYESIRIISEIPNAEKPAMQRGKPVRMSFTLPINAKLQ